MIKSYYGLTRSPFTIDEETPLLEHQQRHFDILKVHAQQGGLCLLIGEPGTGKTVLKNHIINHDPKSWITPVINRSLHTWHNILRILCHNFEIEASGSDHKCEQRLINESRKLYAKGKTIIPIIDDAHLLPIDALRKLRLLLEDFPRNHNLILIGQPSLNTTLQLRANYDIKTRVTYSAKIQQLSAIDMTAYICNQLDQVRLPHSTFTDAAVNLIIRSSEGALRSARNLCVGSLIEAVQKHTKTVDLEHVNAVLLQPHWRKNQQVDHTDQNPIPHSNHPLHQTRSEA